MSKLVENLCSFESNNMNYTHSLMFVAASSLIILYIRGDCMDKPKLFFLSISFVMSVTALPSLTFTFDKFYI